MKEPISALKEFKTAYFDEVNLYRWIKEKVKEFNESDSADLRARSRGLSHDEKADELSYNSGLVDGRNWLIQYIDNLIDE